MTYSLGTSLEMPLAMTIEHVTKKLDGKGFGILTRIDVQHTMKVKPVAGSPPLQAHEVPHAPCIRPVAHPFSGWEV